MVKHDTIKKRDLKQVLSISTNIAQQHPFCFTFPQPFWVDIKFLKDEI